MARNPLVDRELIAKIKDINKVSKAVAFEFIDANGRYASETRRPYKTATIEFANGQKFTMNRVTFEAFGKYKFDVGFVQQ